jgi:predicted nucleic acid-binding protein
VDIKLLPNGEAALIDANIFIYHLSGLSAECTSLLNRIARGEVRGFVTTIIVAETLHRLMMTEAVAKGLISKSKILKKLKDDPEIVKGLTDYISTVETLIKLPVKVIEASVVDISNSHTLRRTYGLFVNDSISLACAQRYKIVNVATNDGDFSRVPTITVWEPTDIP